MASTIIAPPGPATTAGSTPPHALHRPMRVACLFSGGKDSNYARWWAAHQGWDVAALVALVPPRRDARLWHGVASELVPYQAEALDLPLVRVAVGEGETAELEGLVTVLEAMTTGAASPIDGVVTGGLRSEYQRRRFDQACARVGVRSFHPLWHTRPAKLLGEMVREGWDVRLVACAAEGLGPEWLLRRLDEDALDELLALAKEHRFNADGEGGEYESAVLDGPGFAARLEVDADPVWEGNAGHVRVNRVELVHPAEKVK